MAPSSKLIGSNLCTGEEHVSRFSDNGGYFKSRGNKYAWLDLIVGVITKRRMLWRLQTPKRHAEQQKHKKTTIFLLSLTFLSASWLIRLAYCITRLNSVQTFYNTVLSEVWAIKCEDLCRDNCDNLAVLVFGNVSITHPAPKHLDIDNNLYIVYR